MVFPVVGGNESKGYEISNSLRFNPGDSPRLTRTTGTATNETKFTYSTWIKQNVASSGQFAWLTSGSLNSGTDCFLLNFNDQKFQFVTTGATDANVISSAVFRDESAWYHFVVEVDTTQGTAANRMKFYVNGTQLTSFGTASYPSQNYTFTVSSQTAVLGAYDAGGYAGHFDGYMAETHYIDGTAYDADNFGETNDNGVWIPKKFTGSYGTNGFFLEFKQTGTSQNSSGIGADTSGNDNHFAVTNITATDVTEDTPTNNFCTINALDKSSDFTLSEGNLRVASGGSNYGNSRSTFALSSGKWYWEARISHTGTAHTVGITTQAASLSTYLGNHANDYAYARDGTKWNNNSSSSYGASYADGDIIGIALDLDGGTLIFYKNGSSQGTAFSSLSGEFFPAFGDIAGADDIIWIANFGQEGSFAGTETAQGNSDGKYGNFYYAPPSGYYALCTKRLAEFG